MQYRITSGTATLALAAILATGSAFENLSVDGAFIVFELPADVVGAKEAVMNIAEAVSALRDEAYEAGESFESHTTLINTAMGLVRDIDRDFNVTAAHAVVSEANGANQESQPTAVTDSAIDDASKQSSFEASNQEHQNEAEFEQQENKQVNAGSGRNRSK